MATTNPSRLCETSESSTSVRSVLLLNEHGRPPPVRSGKTVKEPLRQLQTGEQMTIGIDLLGSDMTKAFAQHLDSLSDYREGRIAGSRHAQRSVPPEVRDACIPVVGDAGWQSQGLEWFLRGFCDSLAAYEISC
jgi:hypothetical protein